MRHLLFCIVLVGLLPQVAHAGTWDRRHEGYEDKVNALLNEADLSLMMEKWDQAGESLKRCDWYFDHWNKNGFTDHEKVKPLAQRWAQLKKRLANKEALDSQREKTVWYIRREGGKKKKGGKTPEVPLKFLYKALEQAMPGDEIRVAGPVYGKYSAGHLKYDKPHLTIKGGYDDEFTKRDSKGSMISRKPDTTVKSLDNHLLELLNAAYVTLDGLVFDPQYHNRYEANQNLMYNRSPYWGVLRIKASGPVTIRNCVFLNCAGPAIELITTEGAEVTIENCVFINNVAESISIKGKGKVIVKQNTFAMLWSQRSRPGCAVRIHTEGSLIFSDNLVSYADMAVMSVNGNDDIELENNAIHGLSNCFIQLAGEGTTQYLQLKDLEDTELEEDGNHEADPDLTLNPESALKYLSSVSIGQMENKELHQKLLTRYAERMPIMSEEEQKKAEAPKEEPKEEFTDPLADNDEGDPFAKDLEEKEKDVEGEGAMEDPFAEKPATQPADDPESKEAEVEDVEPEPVVVRKTVKAGPYYAPLYVYSLWLESANSIEAGAKTWD